jgi:hypothetical protein
MDSATRGAQCGCKRDTEAHSEGAVDELGKSRSRRQCLRTAPRPLWVTGPDELVVNFAGRDGVEEAQSEGASSSRRGESMSDQFDVTLDDADLGEVELAMNLMIAASGFDRRLTCEEIDRVLGVEPASRLA